MKKWEIPAIEELGMKETQAQDSLCYCEEGEQAAIAEAIARGGNHHHGQGHPHKPKPPHGQGHCPQNPKPPCGQQS